jgi:hypothetical protein
LEDFMKAYRTSTKSAGQFFVLLLLAVLGSALGRAQTSETRIGRLAGHKLASVAAPRAASPSASVAAQRYVFGRVDLAVGDAPYALAVGAFRTGGPPSIAVANYFSDTVSILLGNPDGTYQTHVDYATGAEPNAIVAADFNGDHNLDLAVANWAGGTVSILLGNGDGTFQPHVDYAVGGGYVSSLAAGDFNHDNKLDLAVTSEAAYTVAILLGNGDGTFQPQVSYPAGDDPTGIAAADFNGDHRLDLAIAASSDQVSILLGNGDGTFQPPVQYATGAIPFDVVAGDFNGDHKLDLATVNATGNSVSVLLGNGDGTFQSHVDYAAGNTPYAVAAGDFNGDGVLDLAVTSYIGNTVSLLLGKGNGTFQARKIYGTGLQPWGVFDLVAGDLNGDGGADLAVPNFGSNTVSVLLNLPVISVFPSTVAFGNEPVGTKSKAHTIVMGNPSGTPFGIGSIKIAGADAGDFAETNTCPVSPATLAAGATCHITVTFTPAATGKRNAKIGISDTVPGSPQSLALTGNGT